MSVRLVYSRPDPPPARKFPAEVVFSFWLGQWAWWIRYFQGRR